MVRARTARKCVAQRPKMEDAARLDVPGGLAEGRNPAVGHLESLPFAVDVPRAAAPLRIEAEGGRRQIARISFTGKIERVIAMQIGAAISGDPDAQALPDRVSGAAGPVSVLVVIEDAAAVGG